MRPVEEPTDQELRNVWKYLALGAGQTIAAEALSRRGYADALEFVKAVIRKDPTTTIRLKPEECAGRAARYVGRMKRNELAPYLRERYNVESSSWIRGNILLGLAALGQEEDKKIFSQAADGKDEFIRYSALLALAMTGDKPAAEKLEAGMESSDGRIMLISAWGQGIVKNPKAIKLLEDVVDKKGSKSYVLPPLPGDVKTHTTGGNLDYCMRILAGDALLDLAVRNQ
jgi:HEAT repeat protein